MKGASEGKREAMEAAEGARDAEWKSASFSAELFLGRLRTDLILPFPQQPEEDLRVGDAYVAKVADFLREHHDPEEFDHTTEIRPRVLQGLKDLGTFRMKIPTEYGGLGFSQRNYCRVNEMIASYCGSLTAWVSAHQSIGVPQPLKMFGTEAQKKKFFPVLAAGSISAFALTEPDAGSDPARMVTTATPTEDGKAFLINGDKLWCTNGPVADLLVVMARTPSITVQGRERKQITAFILDRRETPFEVVHRCDFMGLRGIQNGLLRFRNARVPAENILLGPGRGLKLALTTLNTGRLTLPAACLGAAKQALKIARTFAKTRVQWGSPIGEHEAIAGKLARMAAQVFALEAVVQYPTMLVDRGGADIRLEAALAKLYGSEATWDIIQDAVQIRGGRGYETAASLKARGETPYPLERMSRESRINTLFEGSSEIMRLFIAREALDAHMRPALPILSPKTPLASKAVAAAKLGTFYAGWYPRQWIHTGGMFRHGGLGSPLAGHMRYVERGAHRLARASFHAMMRHQLSLEKRQQLLGRIVDIGMYLHTMALTCAYAKALADARLAGDDGPRRMADLFCRHARVKVEDTFRHLRANADRSDRACAKELLAGNLAWLEEGILHPWQEAP